MLTYTHSDCKHVIQTWGMNQTIIDCPVCKLEAEWAEEAKTDSIAWQNEDKAKYYNQTYGDEI